MINFRNVDWEIACRYYPNFDSYLKVYKKYEKHQWYRSIKIIVLIVSLFFGIIFYALDSQPISGAFFFLAFFDYCSLFLPGPFNPNVHPDRYNERQEILQEARDRARR